MISILKDEGRIHAHRCREPTPVLQISPTGCFLFPSSLLYINGSQHQQFCSSSRLPKEILWRHFWLWVEPRNAEEHPASTGQPPPIQNYLSRLPTALLWKNCFPSAWSTSVVNDTREVKLLWSIGGLASYKCKNLLSWRSKAT